MQSCRTYWTINHVECWLEWSNWMVSLVFLPMSAKMGVFGADLWIFLADRTIEFAGDLKMFYYRDLGQWPCVKAFLLDTCLIVQDSFNALLDYFHIKYRG